MGKLSSLDLVGAVPCVSRDRPHYPGKAPKADSNPECDAERLTRTVVITVTGLDPSAASQNKSHSLKYMLGSYLAKEAGTVDRISAKSPPIRPSIQHPSVHVRSCTIPTRL